MSHTPNEVINPLNQYIMEKERYMLIHMDKNIYRFKWLSQAKYEARKRFRLDYEYYIIVDTWEDKVIYKWSY